MHYIAGRNLFKRIVYNKNQFKLRYLRYRPLKQRYRIEIR
jgi:hypothetical protein